MTTKPRCYLDIEIDNEPVGRVVVELFSDICPITCENFRALCTGERGLGQVTKKPLWYKNTLFHRVVKNFVIQSGDFECGNGTGGESIYGGQFDDENFEICHNKPYLLSMANKGKNTNGSQFFITLQASNHLDQLHTVFGHIVSGHEVIKQIGTIKTDQNSKPLKEVKIAQCGELVLRSEKRRKRKDSTSESSSEEEKRRRKKKHKKEKKKSKKEKKSKGFYASNNKTEEDINCNVDPDEIPAIPANVFLMRRTSPVAEFRSRTPRGRESFKRGPPSRTRSGRKVKGRGNMRYRTPSSSDERSGSETPPHWKQAQSRLQKYSDVVKEKEKDKDSDSELSSKEDNENESQHNPFLQSRLGLVSARNFEDERRREKDARMNINENRQRRDYSQESSRYNRDDESNRDNESGSLFERLMQEDERHGKSWFDENNEDQSEEEHGSPLRSKIVVKSSVSRRDSRDNRRGNERENYRRHDANSRRRDSPSDKRSRTFHRDSSSGHDNSYKKASHHSENRRETNKASNDKTVEKPKPLSVKAKKKLNLLENDLFRYNKGVERESKVPPKKRNKPTSKVVDDKVTDKKEETMQTDLINSVCNDNLAALKEYETKSNEKFGHESSDNTQAESSTNVLEKDKTEETVSVTNNIEYHESQQSGSSPLKEVMQLEKGLENSPSTAKFSPDINETGKSPVLIASEETCKELEFHDKDRLPSSNFKYNESEKAKVEHTEKNEQKLKSTEKKGEKEYKLPDERKDYSKNTENIPLRGINDQMDPAEEREMENQDVDANVQVAENSSTGSHEIRRKECQSKDKKNKNDNKRKTSLHRRSSSPNQEPQKSDKKAYDRMSNSPSRSKSPLHHKTVKKRMSKSPDNQKASSSKQSHLSHSRRSKSPLNRAKSPISRRKRPDTRRSKSCSRSRSAHRSSSRNRGHRKYSRSPDVRLRRSRSRSHSRNVGRGSRSYRYSGVRNRSPEFRNSFQRRNKSPTYRGRARGRSVSRRSNTRSRSHSVDKKRRYRRQVSSSSSSSSSSSGSDTVKRRDKKNSSVKSRNNRSSSSSSSTASSRSKRSNS